VGCMAPKPQNLDETIRQLRAAGRKRATVGGWKVTIGQHYATFEPRKEDS
jgi:hypothetical protein